MAFWHNRRVLVTGGNAFLGKYVARSFDCAQERERGAAEITIAPRSSQYDLRDLSAIRRALSDSKPQMGDSPRRAHGWHPAPLCFGEATHSARTWLIPPNSSTII